MIKVENIDVWGFEHAIRGMRNPMNSWDKSDSTSRVVWVDEGYRIPIGRELTKEDIVPDHWKTIRECKPVDISTEIGPNDIGLMRKLYKAGTEHRKYLRQIFVSMDIVAPLYWWKEFDTYKVGTVANSCSTMHKIAAKEFELDDFSHEHLLDTGMWLLETMIDRLNKWRSVYVLGNQVYEPKNKDIWWQMIQLLPSSYNQKRTITMNYENAITMIKQRTGHKLDEWREFVEILSKLPYIDEICGE